MTLDPRLARCLRSCPPRTVARIVALLLLGLVVWRWPAGWRAALPSLSPFVAIGSAIALRTVSVVSLLSLPMLFAVVLRRRFWCRYLCPVGLIAESCGKLRGRQTQAIPFGAFSPGRLLALATFGGALAGYPLFLWMDPLALFSGSFSAAQVVRSQISVLSLAGLPVVILISLLFPGTWCSKICPSGATQDLLSLAGRFFSRHRQQPSTGFAGRRGFLALGLGSFAALIPKARAGNALHLRPPGSVDDTSLKGDCLRCGSCWRACPTGIIKPTVDAGDPAGFLVPSLEFAGPNYCLQDCNLCGKACPTGVIQPLPLEEKNRRVIGIARIDLSDCLLVQDRECGICVLRCPRSAIVEVFSRETYTTIVKVLPERCNGCGACVGICPPKVVKVEAVCPAAARGRRSVIG